MPARATASPVTKRNGRHAPTAAAETSLTCNLVEIAGEIARQDARASPRLDAGSDDAIARHHHDLAVLALDGLDPAETRQVRSRRHLEQPAATVLDHGVVAIDVEQLPTLGQRRLGVLLCSNRTGDVGRRRRYLRRGLLRLRRAMLEAIENVP